ncbi:MAG: hypothetical protein [aquatic viral metagenome]
MEKIHSPEGLNEALARHAKHGDVAVPVPFETLTVEARISDFPGLKVMAEEFYKALHMMLGDRLQLKQEDIEDALRLVLEMRIFYVRDELPQTMVNLRNVEFPAVLLPLVLAIGIVDVDRVIRLKPVLEKDGKPVSVQEWARDLPRRLELLRTLVSLLDLPDVRAEISVFPRGKDGALELYAFIVQSDQLVTDKHTRDRVLAVFRSVLDLTLNIWVFGRPVWSYGSVTLLREEIAAITRATLRGSVRQRS